MRVSFSPSVPKVYRFQLAWVVAAYFKGQIESREEFLATSHRRGLPVTNVFEKDGVLFVVLKPKSSRPLFLRCSPTSETLGAGETVEEVQDDE